MSNDKEKKPLTLSNRGKLELKKTVEAGQVRQSFSHGRSKSVLVERKKKRSFAPGGEPSQAEAPRAGGADAASAQGAVVTDTAHLDHLPGEEKQRRLHALQAAKKADEERARREAEEEARRAVEEAERAAEEAERKKREAEEARVRAEEEARRAAEAVTEAAEGPAAPEEAAPETSVGEAEEAPRADSQGADSQAAPNLADSQSKPPQSTPAQKGAKSADKPVASTEASSSVTAETERTAAAHPERKKRAEDEERGKAAAKVQPKVARSGDNKRRGKLTISAALSDDESGRRGRSVAAMKRAQQKQKRKQQQQYQPAEKVVRDVVIPDTITVQELANRMAERAPNVIKVLMGMGVMATINQTIDADTAQLVAEEFGHSAKRVSEADVEDGLTTGPDLEEDLQPRPPVVTVMGHVDHGKTSLLDALRSTDVVAGEAGGITQHIGAYQVTLSTGAKITFIDTPGHEAFTAMRARGAKVTDIVILVVAADDGIMPQTIEAIRHARAAEVPIVVAVNKIDKPGADPNRVYTELLQHEVVVEQMSGDVLTVEVSAKQRINLEKLEEAVLLQAEILDLKANPERAAEGAIVEAKMEKGRGSVATVLVRRGTLHVGDIFVAGSEWGRVRAMVDHHGRRVEEAGPACPVEIIGLNGVPSAGDELIVLEDEQKAREIAEYRQRKEREKQAAVTARGTMEQMFAKIQAGQAKELPVVIKGDMQGSVEALQGLLAKAGNDEVKVRVLHAAAGPISESDVTLAKASEALVIGFNVRANPQARDMARRDSVDIRYYSIIYDVADDVKRLLAGMLEPTYQEKFIGYAEVRQVFNITKVGKVAGVMVTEGIIKRGCRVRLLRDNVVVHEGDLGQLKRFKDDVKEVREGYECGMSFTHYDNLQIGDVFECYEMEEIEAKL